MTAVLRECLSACRSSAEIRQDSLATSRFVPHPPVPADPHSISRRAFVLAGAYVLSSLRPSSLRAQDASQPPRVRNPRILFITSPDEPECDKELARLRAPGADFARLQSVGWKIGAGPENHLQIVDRSAIPELVSQLDVKHYPTVACIDGERIVRSFQAGCTTPLDMWTFGWLAKGIDERPASSPTEAARAETTGHYPLRGNHWSVDGDWSPTRETVINHLRGPAHARYLNASQEIEKWSYEELRSLHDHLHETYGGGVSASAQRAKSSSNANSFSASRKILGH
ncbi:MAG TPA: hypothetical protein VHD36_11010 [Pirellulales bacterium]|nr:hypothetical protein [Pirellulales bacterium]